MGAKAAGTTMVGFMHECMVNITKKVKLGPNFVNRPEASKSLLTNSLEVTPIIASHMHTNEPLIDIIKNAHENALIIYIHRKETDRIKSAIRHVVKKQRIKCNMNEEKTRCILNEESLVEYIAKKPHEIGIGSLKLLTCGVYDAIVDNAPPNMVFVHYKQVDKLQRLLAKHHCPELLEKQPIKTNIANGSGKYVQLTHGKGLIEIDEWLDKKIDFIEWTLKMRANATCQSNTRLMEHELFQCPHEAIRVPGLVLDSSHW
eukprot:CAMPEP_0195511740 /NCGR_PEP_ID=MMETSP0794_2-20130614/3953_1 /TAXON_ID=515487 /ORGANISM="Stephanopyxis turris, Strain CCMP 815" /LENGTH=258 /DNA_ID=CAMNT_0040639397 /DNA_START=1051 /DNA_END=1830 /DNA_ORIENTATION=-